MSTTRWASYAAGLILTLALAACAPLPAAVRAPEATAAPTATPTPAPTPTPAIPDPKTDPMAALLYTGRPGSFSSAEFDYVMTLEMSPADEASAAALGDDAGQLSDVQMKITGDGAMEVTDPGALKSKMRMAMNLDMAGQQMAMEMIIIDQTAWIRVGSEGEWQKVEGEQATSAIPGGMDPESMLETFQNATDVVWVGDLEIDGEPVSHLRFAIDPAKLDLASLTAMTDQEELSEQELQEILQDMKPVIDVWITRSNLELRRQVMAFDMIMPFPEELGASGAKLRMAMEMDMQFRNVNQPVTIEPPAE